MNTKKKLNSINFKTLSYLILFSFGILVLLWITQIVFLNVFYEKYQEDNLIKLANEIYDTDEDDIIEKIEGLTFDPNTCIAYVDKNNMTYYYNNRINGCMLGKNGALNKYILEIESSNEDLKPIKLINPMNKSQSLLYGVKVGRGRVYLYTMLEDMNSTTSVLKGQLIYIVIIVLVLAITISFFLSRKISKPIVNITDKAKKLAEGNYDVKFDKTDILEIDELSDTLNYLEDEISKTDEYRRDLMANVSHDLKTPLTMIKAYAEMVRDISYKDEEKRNANLNVIIDESNRLNILVNDILELSKLQANSANIEKEEFDLITELNEILKRYDIIKETENYKFIVKTPKKVLINADKKRLSQVLYNLINNAINYTGSDKKVYITITDNKKYYHVEIKDTGKGIDKKDINHIWDKYYKKEKNHKRNVVGTGLGLSIVKNILVNHNFNYGVNSIKDKGSTFYFDIPKIKD
ncbi:MAG: HAMP domain-containing histidine kinase [Bacilli bacterium]|nr:HAMP domain-containing histidine kinase [Bacilli bacterium]